MSIISASLPSIVKGTGIRWNRLKKQKHHLNETKHLKDKEAMTDGKKIRFDFRVVRPNLCVCIGKSVKLAGASQNGKL